MSEAWIEKNYQDRINSLEAQLEEAKKEIKKLHGNEYWSAVETTNDMLFAQNARLKEALEKIVETHNTIHKNRPVSYPSYDGYVEIAKQALQQLSNQGDGKNG